ncbi:MAG: GIY-YIG nuclease family protein [Alphaproteobacteria bacterium]|nr:GIY-YIG nuclease family protein [Alphaproteobacteria bacterium]
MKTPCVYIMASQRNGTLYIGVTSDLRKRVWEHKEQQQEGFTKKYKVNQLVWYEIYEDMSQAILKEKQLKKWERNWKLRMIEDMNPTWQDLYNSL